MQPEAPAARSAGGGPDYVTPRNRAPVAGSSAEPTPDAAAILGAPAPPAEGLKRPREDEQAAADGADPEVLADVPPPPPAVALHGSDEAHFRHLTELFNPRGPSYPVCSHDEWMQFGFHEEGCMCLGDRCGRVHPP